MDKFQIGVLALLGGLLVVSLFVAWRFPRD
jgi:preprotein translocase subunit SecF